MKAGESLLGEEQKDTNHEKRKRKKPVMVPFVAVGERDYADRQRKQDHEAFEINIMNNVKPEYRHCREEQRQDGAMDRTSQGSRNAERVVVYPKHGMAKLSNFATSLQLFWG